MTEVEENNAKEDQVTSPATPGENNNNIKKKETIIRRNRPGSKAEVCYI